MPNSTMTFISPWRHWLLNYTGKHVRFSEFQVVLIYCSPPKEGAQIRLECSFQGVDRPIRHGNFNHDLRFTIAPPVVELHRQTCPIFGIQGGSDILFSTQRGGSNTIRM